MDPVIIKFVIDYFPGIIPLLTFFLYFKNYREINEKIIESKITIKEATKLFDTFEKTDRKKIIQTSFIEKEEIENYLKRKDEIINNIYFLSGEGYLMSFTFIISSFFSFLMLSVFDPSVFSSVPSVATKQKISSQENIIIFIGIVSFILLIFAYFITNKKLIEVKRFFMLGRTIKVE